NNLIVNYLPHAVSSKRLAELFAPYGAVAHAKVVRDRATGGSLGYGFVRFARAAGAAAAATALDGARVGDKRIRVSAARPSSASIRRCKLHVAGLPVRERLCFSI
ncbi:RNA-binding domain of Hu antigen C, partial [Tribonema minus]